MAKTNREKLEALAWRNTHRDFRGKREDGTKVVNHYIPELGTCSVALSSLTNGELIGKLSRYDREQCAEFLAQFDPSAKS